MTDFEKWIAAHRLPGDTLHPAARHGGRALCRPNGILCMGQSFVPDQSKAWVEFFVAHAFPVVTIDATAFHPQVVANSYRSMWGQVFDLNHLMMKYNRQLKKDQMLGSVFAVEYPPPPEGGWRVQSDVEQAPGIRGVAVLHKAAEAADGVLKMHATRQVDWTVSMENNYDLRNSGFVIREDGREIRELDGWREKTPDDLSAQGWTYIPALESPLELLECFDFEQSKMSPWQQRETIVFFGGLNGSVHFSGLGLTPEGKEHAASVGQMLASGKPGADEFEIELTGLLQNAGRLPA